MSWRRGDYGFPALRPLLVSRCVRVLPRWLVPLWLLNWLDERDPALCWTDMYIWKVLAPRDEYREHRWLAHPTCTQDAARTGLCWCNKFGPAA